MAPLNVPQANNSVFACLSPISLGDIQQMDMSLSRLDCLFVAKVADQAERYHGTFCLILLLPRRDMYGRPLCSACRRLKT